MYIPKYFEVTDKEEIFAFVESNAFGQLISNVGGKLFSTHMPFLLSDDKTKIIGHLAIQNPQHSDLSGQEVLITLQGPHDYISPSWYASPGVPTWNYQAVHIYGKASVFSSSEKIKSVVDTLTQKYESSFSQPWKPEYKAAMLSALVGVEITISEIQCKYKLSQNRSSQDREQVVTKLNEVGSHELASSMVRNQL
ncbi:FMN-binding negative transcriptional regulator [Thalassolituus oleivorans]|uniref:FMN-binding negative transcriptional regulator n=1 Tax=Thalassolituus oleivorans TaxID=187493 RepID=UPI0023F4B4C7|nr:FMN-binding negative transcriptional regulator [Thalassolituus oleivorans]